MSDHDVVRHSYSPSFAGITQAQRKLSQIGIVTPILPVRHHDATLLAKAECCQRTGSFKLRGAWHRLTALADSERARGVVAFSSGNHAQGIALAARTLGMRATIVMPADAPAAKRDATAALGATIVPYDRATESREAIAAALAAEQGATLVPSFDDPWIIEGQGTLGLEAVGQLAAMGLAAPRRIVIPCGGGGLSAGTALAVPDAEIIVAEPEGWGDMGASLARGAIVPVGPNPPPTACDALQTLRVAERTFAILHARGARGVTVREAEVDAAMRFAFRHLKLVVEPGGAVALAAVLAGRVPAGEGTLVVLSGGNVDPAAYAARLTGPCN